MKLKVKVMKNKNYKIFLKPKNFHHLKKFILFMILLINLNYLILEFMQMVIKPMDLIMLKQSKNLEKV